MAHVFNSFINGSVDFFFRNIIDLFGTPVEPTTQAEPASEKMLRRMDRDLLRRIVERFYRLCDNPSEAEANDMRRLAEMFRVDLTTWIRKNHQSYELLEFRPHHELGTAAAAAHRVIARSDPPGELRFRSYTTGKDEGVSPRRPQ